MKHTLVSTCQLYKSIILHSHCTTFSYCASCTLCTQLEYVFDTESFQQPVNQAKQRQIVDHCVVPLRLHPAYLSRLSCLSDTRATASVLHRPPEHIVHSTISKCLLLPAMPPLETSLTCCDWGHTHIQTHLTLQLSSCCAITYILVVFPISRKQWMRNVKQHQSQ